MGKKILEGVFTGKKPKVNHFRIFGNISYFHVPDEKRANLDQTAEKGFLVGYSKINMELCLILEMPSQLTKEREKGLNNSDFLLGSHKSMLI